MDALYYLARIADYREQYARAVRFYKEVRFGSNTVFSQRRASALLAHQLDDVDGAFKLLDDFAIASPNNAVEVVALKAQLLISLDRYDEGLALFEKAIEYRPDDEGMILGHAELLLRIGRIDDAVVEYRKAIKRWPDSATALNALGYTLADRTDQYKEAEKLIRKALRHEEALQELQRAYEKLNDHEVASHLVEVLAVLERHDEALELLESAEKKTPDSELLSDVRERYFPATP